MNISIQHYNLQKLKEEDQVVKTEKTKKVVILTEYM